MHFLTLFQNLNTVRDLFPGMTWEPNVSRYHGSNVVITIPVSEENAQLLLDAISLFDTSPSYVDEQDRDEPPF